MTTGDTMYKHTDKVLSALNRQFIRQFRRLQVLNFDELNVVNQVASVYRQMDKLARKSYLDIAIYAYLFGLLEASKAGYDVDIPDAENTPIDVDWIEEMLEEEDVVTLYRYKSEWRRKRQRLVEALAAVTSGASGGGKANGRASTSGSSKANRRTRGTSTPKQELDKALKYAVQQVSHYADKATAEAVIKAYKDAGVEKVMWVTEKDERVCEVCRPLDGKIFNIDEVPPLPAHWRCRCTLAIV